MWRWQGRSRMKTALIAATKRQLSHDPSTKVRDHFSPSLLFRYSLAYCEENFDQVFVVCAGTEQLLHPDSLIGDIDTNKQTRELEFRSKKSWLRSIANQLKEHCPQESEIHFHTPKWHFQLIKWLHKPNPITFEPSIYTIVEPLKSMPIGKRLKFYKQQVGQLPSIKK